VTFIPIPHTVMVRFHLVTGALKASFSLFFTRDDFTVQDITDLLTSLEGGFCADVMSPLCDDYNMNLLEAWDMTAVDGYKVTHEVDIDGGTSPENTPVSPALCCVVTFKGNRRGKWNAGRNFVPGLSEQSVDQVDIQQGVADAIQSAYASLISDPPEGWVWVIASRYFEKEKRAEGVTTPVYSTQVRSNRFGVQKRRAARP
jgi:hypothetical protein